MINRMGWQRVEKRVGNLSIGVFGLVVIVELSGGFEVLTAQDDGGWLTQS